MSYADKVFVENVKDILENGVWDTDKEVRPHWEDGTPAHTVKKFCVVNRYDLQKEFPIITVRRTFSSPQSTKFCGYGKKIQQRPRFEKQNLGQLGGRKRQHRESVRISTCEKSIYKEGEFDQVDRVLFDLKNNPQSRRIMTNIYNFDDLHEMNLYPCAYSMTFNVSGDTLNGILNQRSQDTLTANNWNVVQYAVLLHMFAQVSGLKAGELVHVIADAHIYDRHVPIIKEVIEKPQYPAPKFWINPDVKNFYDFTVDDFRLEGYKFNDLDKKIEVAI